jgi:hypothetical protein
MNISDNAKTTALVSAGAIMGFSCHYIYKYITGSSEPRIDTLDKKFDSRESYYVSIDLRPNLRLMICVLDSISKDSLDTYKFGLWNIFKHSTKFFLTLNKPTSKHQPALLDSSNISNIAEDPNISSTNITTSHNNSNNLKYTIDNPEAIAALELYNTIFSKTPVDFCFKTNELTDQDFQENLDNQDNVFSIDFVSIYRTSDDKLEFQYELPIIISDDIVDQSDNLYSHLPSPPNSTLHSPSHSTHSQDSLPSLHSPLYPSDTN